MASIDTRLLKAIGKGDIGIYEARQRSCGFFWLAKKNGNKLIERDIVEKRKSLTQDVVIPVLKKGATGSSGTRPLGAIPASVAQSALVQLTESVFERHFTMMPSASFANMIDYDTEWLSNMKQLQIAMMQDMDAYIYTILNAIRSQVDNSGVYPIVADAFAVPNADIQEVLNELDGIYLANDFGNSNLNIVANPTYYSQIQNILEFSAENSQNKTLRLGNKEIGFSSSIVTGASKHVLFTGSESNVEILNFNDPASRMGLHGDSNEFGEILLPLLGMNVGFRKTTTQVASGDGTHATLMESTSVSTNLAVITPYASDPAVTPTTNTRANISA